MSKSARALDNLHIASPCTADWNRMVGNEQVRFCEHCKLSVHNISEMRASDALRLVRNSKGRLCVRYVSTSEGTVKTLPSLRQLYSIKRRASRIAAGAFGAALSLSAAGAHALPLSQAAEPDANEYEWSLKSQSAQDGSSGVTQLSGTVCDIEGNAVPAVTVTLINEVTKQEISAFTDDEGGYLFSPLTAGTYTLVAEAPGFTRFEQSGIELSESTEESVSIRIQSSATVVSSGMVIITEPKEPLVKAAYSGDVDEVKRLLAAGEDVDVLDESFDATALDVAVGRGNREIVGVLLKAGADPNRVNSKGQTALMSLSGETTPAIIKDLLASRVRVEAVDEDGESALMVAARINNVELLKTVLSQTAKVNERNEGGQTALMLAAREGNLKNVEALIEALADVNIKDDDDWTALRFAEVNSHAEVAELLKSYGAVE